MKPGLLAAQCRVDSHFQSIEFLTEPFDSSHCTSLLTHNVWNNVGKKSHSN